MLSNKHFLVFFVVTIFFLSFINNNNHFYITIPKGFPNPEIPKDNELNKDKIKSWEKAIF